MCLSLSVSEARAGFMLHLWLEFGLCCPLWLLPSWCWSSWQAGGSDNFPSSEFIPYSSCDFSCSDFPASLILDDLVRGSVFMETWTFNP